MQNANSPNIVILAKGGGIGIRTHHLYVVE
jgi:hypothetical protein